MDTLQGPIFTEAKFATVKSVLEAAIDAEDAMVINACRRLIKAKTIGWRNNADIADWRLVKQIAEDALEG